VQDSCINAVCTFRIWLVIIVITKATKPIDMDGFRV